MFRFFTVCVNKTVENTITKDNYTLEDQTMIEKGLFKRKKNITE